MLLDGVKGTEKSKIHDMLNSLEASGSTYGEKGLQLAYECAEKNFIKGGNNRVILCTDGDFNVGMSTTSEMENFIAKKEKLVFT